jgi:hypothetical protein
LDALPFALASGSVATPALPDGLNSIELFVRPVRETLAVTTLPPTGVVGETVMLVTQADLDENYQFLQGLYVYTSTGWQLRDKVAKANLDPNLPYMPEDSLVSASSDFRHLPFNKIVGASAAVGDEPSILYPANVGTPVTMPGMGPSFARFASGFKLAEVMVKLTAGAIANAATDVKIVRTSHVDLF